MRAGKVGREGRGPSAGSAPEPPGRSCSVVRNRSAALHLFGRRAARGTSPVDSPPFCPPSSLAGMWVLTAREARRWGEPQIPARDESSRVHAPAGQDSPSTPSLALSPAAGRHKPCPSRPTAGPQNLKQDLGGSLEEKVEAVWTCRGT